MTIKVFDNSIKPELITLIERTLYCPRTSWNIPGKGFTTTNVSNLKERMIKNIQIVDSWQFVHSICADGKILSNLHPLITDMILDWLSRHLSLKGEEVGGGIPINLLRIKANLMPLQKVLPEKEIFYNPPHFDPIPPDLSSTNQKMIIFLYYVNESDGDTFFFKDYLDVNIEKRISPKKGRVVLFDGEHCHASSPPQQTKSRCVINANILCPFKVEDIG